MTDRDTPIRAQPNEGHHDIAIEAERMIDQASLRVAQGTIHALLSVLSDPDTPALREIMMKRQMSIPNIDLLESAGRLLSVDPHKSGIRVPRYQIQDGSLPTESIEADINDADKVLTLWSTTAEHIPKLVCPESLQQDVLLISRALGMFGGGPNMFSREEAKLVAVTDASVVNIVGGANRANIERIRTAIALLTAHSYPDVPVIATVNPYRVMKQPEREKVAEFAPDATNEFELFVASALTEGFVPDQANLFGSKILPNGASFIRLNHPQTGVTMIVLCSEKLDEKTGVFKAYSTLQSYGDAIIGYGFSLDKADMVHVTSTHYAPMAGLNNFEAARELGIRFGSFQTIGDNQPTRSPQAHLIEIGAAVGKAAKLLQDPTSARVLLAD